VCIEGLVQADEQVVLIDPKGEGYGLQSSFDGKSKGLDVIVFGEPYGNIKLLREEHAEYLADYVTTSGRSIVLSLLGFDSDMAERRFVTKFFKRLFRNKSRQQQKSRLQVVIDEAHLFAPEGSGSGFKGDMAELVGSIQRCVRQGRAYGMGVMLIDQRPADVSKKLITQCEMVVMHTLSHNTDRKALKDWLAGFGGTAQHEAMLEQVSSLQAGEAFVWSPAWLKVFERVTVDGMTTFDSGAAPDADEASQPRVRADVDIEALESTLQKLVEEEKSSDPRQLQKQVLTLQQKLQEAEQKPAQVDTVAYEQLQQQYESLRQQAEYDKRALESEVAVLRTKIGRIRRLLGDAAAEAQPLVVSSPYENGPGTLVIPPSKSLPPAAIAARPVRTLSEYGRDKPQGRPELQTRGSASGQNRLLAVMREWPGIQRRNLAIRSLMTPDSGTFTKYLSNLRTAGLIDEQSGFRPTPSGEAAAAAFPQPLRGQDLRDAWLSRVGGGGETRMFAALLNAGGGWLSRQELGELAGLEPDSGTFTKYLSNIRVKGLMDEDRRQGFKAADVFFEEG